MSDLVVVQWTDDLWHVPQHERNIFFDNNDKWWGTRCLLLRTSAEWPRAKLHYGAPTCFFCIEIIETYKAKYGRYPPMRLP